MSIIKHVTVQKIVAHDFRYDPRNRSSGLVDEGFISCSLQNSYIRRCKYEFVIGSTFVSAVLICGGLYAVIGHLSL